MDKPVKMTAEGMAWMLTSWIAGRMPILIAEPLHTLDEASYLALFAFGSALIIVGSAMIFAGGFHD